MKRALILSVGTEARPDIVRLLVKTIHKGATDE
jgi:hypothetical protein